MSDGVLQDDAKRCYTYDDTRVGDSALLHTYTTGMSALFVIEREPSHMHFSLPVQPHALQCYEQQLRPEIDGWTCQCIGANALSFTVIDSDNRILPDAVHADTTDAFVDMSTVRFGAKRPAVKNCTLRIAAFVDDRAVTYVDFVVHMCNNHQAGAVKRARTGKRMGAV